MEGSTPSPGNRADENVLVSAEQLNKSLDGIKTWKMRYKARAHVAAVLLQRDQNDITQLFVQLGDEWGRSDPRTKNVFELIKLINYSLVSMFGNDMNGLYAARAMILMVIMKRQYDPETFLAGMRQLTCP